MSTITETASAATVRSFYDALAHGDMQRITELCSPDITVQIAGTSPLAGLYDGRDAALGELAKMQELARGTFRAELRELYVNGDSVVARHHGTADTGAKQLDAEAALVFTVRDGAITLVKVHQARQEHWDEFFS
jgi:ketosteroid isomerase-like protein